MTKYLHDPNARLDYGVDWGRWLSTGETITDHTVMASGGSVDVESSAVVGTQVVAWISGGAVGEVVTITVHVETNQGRKDDRSYKLQVRER